MIIITSATFFQPEMLFLNEIKICFEQLEIIDIYTV